MRKSAQLRKAEIVAAVLDLADRIGPDRVTTSAAASAVGVSQAALFRHFPTKDAMWLAVTDHVAGELTTAWERALAGTDEPIDRLKTLMAAQLGQIAATPALPMLLFSRELNVGNDTLRAAFRDLLMRFQALITAELTRGQDMDCLRRDLAPPLLCRLPWAFWADTVPLWLALPSALRVVLPWRAATPPCARTRNESATSSVSMPPPYNAARTL